MKLAQLRRTLVARNGAILAMLGARADTLAALGLRIARGERVTDEETLEAFGTLPSEAIFALHAGTAERAAREGDEGRADEVRAVAARLAQPLFVPGAGGRRIALVSFRGAVDYDVELQPYMVSSRRFTRVMKELTLDDSVTSIVVVFNSPGGLVTGTPEAADALFAAREAKKVTAVVDTMAASAAYWIASQASEIVCLPSGLGVGSIGVRMMHLDCSRALQAGGITPTLIYEGKYKVEGNMFEPLGEEARARYQLECAMLYGDFLEAVARGRGVPVAKVREEFGQGRLLMPAEARKAGMLDRLEETDASFQRLGLLAAPAAARRADIAPSHEGIAARERLRRFAEIAAL
ncbi:MAG: S49 family peptidase [Hyphomicrobiaceae bacterium]